MRGTIASPASIAAADIVIIAPFVRMVSLHIQDTSAIRAIEQPGKQSDFIKPRRASALVSEFLHTFPGLNINDRLMMILENDLLFDWILQSTFAFVGLLFGLEIHQASKILSAFENVCDGIIRPTAFMAGMIAPCAAGSAKFKCSGRRDFLLRQHPGNSGRTIPSHT